MFGFLLGTACLIGLIWVIRGPHGHPSGRCGGRWERHRQGGEGWREGGERGGFGRMAFMRWLFERLDTTPGQERVIRQAVDDLVDQAFAARKDVEASRRDVARAVRGESFDAEAMGEAFAKHDGALTALRRAAIEWAREDPRRARRPTAHTAWRAGRSWARPTLAWALSQLPLTRKEFGNATKNTDRALGVWNLARLRRVRGAPSPRTGALERAPRCFRATPRRGLRRRRPAHQTGRAWRGGRPARALALSPRKSGGFTGRRSAPTLS